MEIICIISYSPGHTFHRQTSGNLHFYPTLVPGCPAISHARRMVHNGVWTPVECVFLTDGEIRNDQAVVDTFLDVSNWPPGPEDHDKELHDFKNI